MRASSVYCGTAAVTAFFSICAWANPVSVDISSRESIPASTVEQVNRFLAYFVEADKPAGEQAALYVNNPSYFDLDGASKTEMIKDMERYRRHWPDRKYRLTDIEYIKLDPDSDRIFVSYAVDFEVANAARQVNGTARYGSTILHLDGIPKMETITEKVISRKIINRAGG